MATNISWTNPFRASAVTPTPTGTSASSAVPDYPRDAQSSTTTTTTTTTSAAPAAPDSSNPTRVDLAVPEFLDEEPPAYTPRADVDQGEETIEYGPRRPFQAPRPPPAQPRPVSQRPQRQLSPPNSYNQTFPRPQSGSLLRQLTGHIGDHIVARLAGPSPPAPSSSSYRGHGRSQSASWAGYPGAQQHYQRQYQPQPDSQLGSPIYAPPPGPPPSHSDQNLNNNTTLHPPPSHPSRRASFSGSARPQVPTATSDFARDFYAVGGDADISQSHSSPSLTTRDDPTSTNPPAPTASPTPGRPLLRDGKLLVYPSGYECHKCHNIGFKHADPSHPCKKCWSKFAKPFSGPVAYAYSSERRFEEEGGEMGRNTFQRPLPAFRSPRSRGLESRSAPAPVPVPPSIFDSPSPTGFSRGFASPPLQGAAFRTLSPYDRAPPLGAVGDSNAVVYKAGDPRLGGRLCWQCEGTGTVSFLIFDESTCETCGGIGRVFR